MSANLVQFRPCSSIVVSPDRQRGAPDELAVIDLASDIQDRTLLHAIVLAENDLLAGETRLRAVMFLHESGKSIYFGTELVPPGTIPCVQLGQLDELEKMEVEWSENERRVPLTWQARAKAEAALHRLRTMQRERAGQPIQTVAQTAAEIRGKDESAVHSFEVTQTREALAVTRFLDDPEIAAAPTRKDAVKIIKRRETMEKNVAAGKAMLAIAPKVDDRLRLIQANCIHWLREQYIGPKFDVVISDPPYGIGAQDFGDGATNQSGHVHQYDDSYESWLELMAAFIPEVTNATAENASMFLFCDFERFPELKSFCQTSGWWVQRTPLIWDKVRSNRLPVPGKSFRRQYECILLAVKGEGTTSAGIGDVLPYPADENLGHGAQKPVELFQALAKAVGAVGKRILDPFGGSGPALEIEGNFVTVIEQLDYAYGIAAQRLARITAQGVIE